MAKQEKITPLPTNADQRPSGFDGGKIADAHRRRRLTEAAAAPMETDGEAGGAPNRPRPDLRPGVPPVHDSDDHDRLFPRKGRKTFLLLLGAGLVVAIVSAVLTGV